MAPGRPANQESSVIDLSSDTQSRPSPGMREFMAAAPVGDEQLREDPSVNRLQEMAAALRARKRPSSCPQARCATPSPSVSMPTAGRPSSSTRNRIRIGPKPVGQPGLPASCCGPSPDRAASLPSIRSSRCSAREALTQHGRHSSRSRTRLIAAAAQSGHSSDWRRCGRWPTTTGCASTWTGRDCSMRPSPLVSQRLPSPPMSTPSGSISPRAWALRSEPILAGSHEFIERARLLKHMFGGAMRQAGNHRRWGHLCPRAPCRASC